MNYFTFIRTLPDHIRPQLPPHIQHLEVHQPFRWVIQMHYGERRLHYEIGRVPRQKTLELALHFEAKDKALNKHMLLGFRRHLFEIRDVLGEGVQAEMWDRGWTKIYEKFPAAENDGKNLTDAYQASVAGRMSQFISVLHPFYVELRQDVTRIHR